jgi:signal peptidase I
VAWRYAMQNIIQKIDTTKLTRKQKLGIFLLVIGAFGFGLILNNILYLVNGVKEIPSPYPRITLEQIHTYGNQVVIDINNPHLAIFANSNSMDPTIDTGMYGVEIIPKTAREIRIGDIISFKMSNSTIAHRVINVGYDKEGWFARTKGDNVRTIDYNKVRFDNVTGVYVGVIY